MVSGFRKCGIFPHNPKVIPDEKFEPEALRRWNAFKATAIPSIDQVETPGSITPALSSSQLQPNADQDGSRELPLLSSSLLHDQLPPSPQEFFPVSTSSPKPSTSTEFVHDPPQSVSHFSEAPLPSTSRMLSTSGDFLGAVSFEHLLLEKLRQTVPAKSARKRICPGAEVITSKEVIERKLEEESKKLANETKMRKKQSLGTKKNEDENNNEKKDGKTEKSKQRQLKSKKERKKEASDEESEDDVFSPVSSSDEDFDMEEEVQEDEEEHVFLNSIQNQKPSPKDWVMVKFSLNRGIKIYVGQVIGIDPCLEVRFARKKRGDDIFYWPQAEDKSMGILRALVTMFPQV
ncbi:hypothetical protein GE061_000892 [Apolygus lucorum]|uniref:Uncharacterized protein n=1 Tax=Apolygus lucorum TaxID=248454 RepID=A0A8S9Y733_APOLU|nr:hypothetical protein GE061_000892 [Apolygus lucorum]